MSTQQSAQAPIRPTYGKTVGRALIRSYLHDFDHQHDADYKPLYTQAQFNRMVSGLRSEVEHRVYSQYIALYNGIVEEYARALGYYQQAMGSLARLNALLSDAVRAQQALSLLAMIPGVELAPDTRPTVAELLMRALHAALDADPGTLPENLRRELSVSLLNGFARPRPKDTAAPARNAHAPHNPQPDMPTGADHPLDGQLSFLPGGGAQTSPPAAQGDAARPQPSLDTLSQSLPDSVSIWQTFENVFPALTDALLSWLEAGGYPARERALLPQGVAGTVPEILATGLYGEEELPPPPDQNNPAWKLSKLFISLSDLSMMVQPADITAPLRDGLLLSAIRWLTAYNRMIRHLASALSLPQLARLQIRDLEIRQELNIYNEDAEILFRQSAPEEKPLAGFMFPQLFWPDAETNAEGIYAQAADVSTYEHSTLQRLILQLAEHIL